MRYRLHVTLHLKLTSTPPPHCALHSVLTSRISFVFNLMCNLYSHQGSQHWWRSGATHCHWSVGCASGTLRVWTCPCPQAWRPPGAAGTPASLHAPTARSGGGSCLPHTNTCTHTHTQKACTHACPHVHTHTRMCGARTCARAHTHTQWTSNLL